MYTINLLAAFATLWHVIRTSARNAYAEEYHTNRRFTCSEKYTRNAASEIQCVQHCLSRGKCSIASYKEINNAKSMADNCEVFYVPSSHKSCSPVYSFGWKGLVLRRKMDSEASVHKSCKDVATNVPHAVSGVYELEDGRHFCRIGDVPHCGSGGWTLALKINGSKATFSVIKDIWLTNVTFNIENGSKSFDNEEAKFNTYSKVSFDAVCIVFKYSGFTKWLRINQKGTSLLDTFETGTYIPTSINQGIWKALIADSSLQKNCNRQGFNVYDDKGNIYARIGYIGNKQYDCRSPDSFIALGSISFSSDHGSNLTSISCENFASYIPGNGDKSLPTMGFILVQ